MHADTACSGAARHALQSPPFRKTIAIPPKSYHLSNRNMLCFPVSQGRVSLSPKAMHAQIKGGVWGRRGPLFWLEKAWLHLSQGERLGGGWKLNSESCWAGGRSWGLLGLTLQNQNHFQTPRGRRKAQGLGEKLAARAGREVTGSHLEHPTGDGEDLTTRALDKQQPSACICAHLLQNKRRQRKIIGGYRTPKCMGSIRGVHPRIMPCSGTVGQPQHCLAGHRLRGEGAVRRQALAGPAGKGFPHGTSTREMPCSVPMMSLRHRNAHPARTRPQHGHPQQRALAPLAAAPGQPARATGFYSSGDSRWILSCYKNGSFYSPFPGLGLVPAAQPGLGSHSGEG